MDTNNSTYQKLLSILKDVKALMDSEQYVEDFDSIYDRISLAVAEENMSEIKTEH